MRAIRGKMNDALLGFCSGPSRPAGVSPEGSEGSSTLKPFVARMAKALSIPEAGPEASAKLKYSFLALGVSAARDALACSAVSFVGQTIKGRSDRITSPRLISRHANAPNPLFGTSLTW